MPLLGQQLNIIQDPRFRAHWPNEAALFTNVDRLIKSAGGSCPRLPPLWDMLMSRNDPALKAWFESTFPGVPMKGGGGSFPTSTPVQPTGQPPSTPVKSPVGRAINVLNSFKKP